MPKAAFAFTVPKKLRNFLGRNSSRQVTRDMATSGEWEELYSEKYKKKYWRNKSTKETTWKDPNNSIKVDSGEDTKIASSGNGNEWEELYSEKYQKKYWRNKITKETTWKDPNSSEVKPVLVTESNSVKVSEDLWEELYSEKYKKKYWRNKNTKEVSWKDPNATVAEVASTITTNQPFATLVPPPPPPPPTTTTSSTTTENVAKLNNPIVSTTNKATESIASTSRASVKLIESASSKVAETTSSNRTSVYRESISIPKADSDEVNAVRVESMNEDNNWILRYTSLLEPWGKIRRKHWYHKVTKEITLISPYILDENNENNEVSQGSSKGDEYVPKKMEELAPFFAYLELGNQGVRMGKRRGTAGATPKQDSLSYLSVQKRWIYFDWASDNVAEWRLVYTKQKLEYKMKVVNENLSIPYLSEETANVGSNSSEVTKHILLKDILHVFLEPSPSTSFRIYTNSKDVNDNLIQLTCPTYDDAIAWVEGIRYAMTLLSLNTQVVTNLRDNFLTKEVTRVNERRKSRVILGMEEDTSANDVEKEASGDEVAKVNTFQRFVSNTVLAVKKITTIPSSNLTSAYDSNNRTTNEVNDPTTDVVTSEVNNQVGGSASVVTGVDLSTNIASENINDTSKPLHDEDNVVKIEVKASKSLDAKEVVVTNPSPPVVTQPIVTQPIVAPPVAENSKPKTKLSYISNLLKGKSKPTMPTASPSSPNDGVTNTAVTVPLPDHESNDISSAEKKKKAFKIKFNRHRAPPAKITSSDAGKVVDMLLTEDNAYRNGTISLQSRYSSQSQVRRNYVDDVNQPLTFVKKAYNTYIISNWPMVKMFKVGEQIEETSKELPTSPSNFGYDSIYKQSNESGNNSHMIYGDRDSDWQLRYNNKYGRKYWQNTKTGQMSWEKPVYNESEVVSSVANIDANPESSSVVQLTATNLSLSPPPPPRKQQNDGETFIEIGNMDTTIQAAESPNHEINDKSNENDNTVATDPTLSPMTFSKNIFNISSKMKMTIPTLVVKHGEYIIMMTLVCPPDNDEMPYLTLASSTDLTYHMTIKLQDIVTIQIDSNLSTGLFRFLIRTPSTSTTEEDTFGYLIFTSLDTLHHSEWLAEISKLRDELN